MIKPNNRPGSKPGCAPLTNTETFPVAELRKWASMEKVVVFRNAFEFAYRGLKEKHGHGAYSWAEGINRRVARRIARVMARKTVREREER